MFKFLIKKNKGAIIHLFKVVDATYIMNTDNLIAILKLCDETLYRGKFMSEYDTCLNYGDKNYSNYIKAIEYANKRRIPIVFLLIFNKTNERSKNYFGYGNPNENKTEKDSADLIDFEIFIEDEFFIETSEFATFLKKFNEIFPVNYGYASVLNSAFKKKDDRAIELREMLIESNATKTPFLFPYNILNSKHLEFWENELGGVFLEGDEVGENLFLVVEDKL